MSHPANDKFNEAMQEFKEENLRKWEDMQEAERNQITAEMALNELTSSLDHLKRLGVDRRIVNDTVINTLNPQDRQWLMSDMDAYERSPSFSRNK